MDIQKYRNEINKTLQPVADDFINGLIKIQQEVAGNEKATAKQLEAITKDRENQKVKHTESINNLNLTKDKFNKAIEEANQKSKELQDQTNVCVSKEKEIDKTLEEAKNNLAEAEASKNIAAKALEEKKKATEDLKIKIKALDSDEQRLNKLTNSLNDKDRKLTTKEKVLINQEDKQRGKQEELDNRELKLKEKEEKVDALIRQKKLEGIK